MLEGFDTARSEVVSRFFLFGVDGYTPADLIKGGQPVDSLGAVVRVRMTDSGRLEIARPEVVTVDEERQVAHASFSPGARVSIRNVGSFGTVVGTDQYGLINVKLDHEVSGTSELQTQAASLRGLTTIKVQKPGFTVLTGRLVQPKRVEIEADAKSMETLPNTPVGESEPEPAGE